MNNTKNLDDLIYEKYLALNYLRDKFSRENIESIEHIKYRLKTIDSIKKKLTKKLNYDFTIENIEKNILDIAGIRIICPFLSDIETVINYIKQQQDIEIINIKDYITTPKESGYSSYHIIVKVPVTINNKQKYTYAEIQIRTLAMDTVASLEHKIIYKGSNKLNKKLQPIILSIISIINSIDYQLDKLYNQTKNNNISSSYNQLPSLFEQEEYKELKNKYRIALLKVETILKNIRLEYPQSGIHSPIEHIKSKLKPDISIYSKLKEKNIEALLSNIEKNNSDIGTITVVCSFLTDTLKIINEIKNNKDIIIIKEKDYITNPKENGYSSYHLKVAVPIEQNNKKTYAKIEIHIRTAIMELWDTMEHLICYQNPNNEESKKQLKEISTKLRKIEPLIDNLAQLVKKENSQVMPKSYMLTLNKKKK